LSDPQSQNDEGADGSQPTFLAILILASEEAETASQGIWRPAKQIPRRFSVFNLSVSCTMRIPMLQVVKSEHFQWWKTTWPRPLQGIQDGEVVNSPYDRC